jgi:hypothetical protein
MEQKKNSYTTFNDVIRVSICGPELWSSYKFFDSSRFPDRLKSYVDACAYNLHLIEYTFKQIEQDINKDKIRLIEELHKTQSSFAGFDPANKTPILLVTYASPRFFTSFGLYLISIKSLLDAYAILVSRSISYKSELDKFSIPSDCKKITGFHKSGNKADGKIGGKFIKSLQNNSPRTYSNKKDMINCFNHHIEEWICDIVTMRDELVHTGVISGFIPMRTPLLKKPKEIQIIDILSPCVLLNGYEVDLIVYSQIIRQNIDSLITETMALFPEIK